MKTLEVSIKKWNQFCQRLQEVCHGGLISIHLERPEGGIEPVVDNLPLQKVSLDDQSDPCNTNLIFEAGLPGQRPARHLVIEPIHLRLKTTGDERRYDQLQITAENGTTVINFHPGLNATELQTFSEHAQGIDA